MAAEPFFIPALLFSVIAIPLIFGWIPRNRWYGIRTAQTMVNDETWYRSNRFGGWAILLSSMIYFVVAKMFPTPKPAGSDFARWEVHLCAFALPLVASVVFTTRYAKGLAKQR